MCPVYSDGRGEKRKAEYVVKSRVPFSKVLGLVGSRRQWENLVADRGAPRPPGTGGLQGVRQL